MTEDKAYLKIAKNIDQGPMTAPKEEGEFSKAFIEFLKLLYTQEEAQLVQHLNRPLLETPKEAAIVFEEMDPEHKKLYY